MTGWKDEHSALGAPTSHSLPRGDLWLDLQAFAALLGVIIGWVLALAVGVVIIIAELTFRP
jgi:hypothetical protein